ncbi:M48 family metallopeptidase [Ottowia oryzae]
MLQMLLDLFDDARRVRAPHTGATPESKPEAPLAQVVRAPGAPQIVASAPPVALADAVAPAQFAHPRANQSIRFAHAQVAYEFRRGQRCTIGFQVGADGLTVSAPRWTPMAEVEAVLRAKERWIVTKLSEARERHARLESARIEWREGAQLPFLGEPVVLVLDPRQRHGRGGAVLVPSEPAGEGAGVAPSPMALHIGLPQAATAQQLRDTVQAWLMRQARRLFTERLDHFAPQLGVQWKKLSLSSADTRWGSASADGSIRLNWRLIHFRLPVIDYVVVHELAHLREMNHSPRFWQHVEDVLPDYADRREQLKGEAVPRW